MIITGAIPQFGQSVRMRDVIGRQVDREPGFDCRNYQTPVLDSDRIVAEDGLVGEGDDVFAGVGGDQLFEERTVDLQTVSREVAGLGVPPQTAHVSALARCRKGRGGPRQQHKRDQDHQADRGWR
jgi:hypothetical protein